MSTMRPFLWLLIRLTANSNCIWCQSRKRCFFRVGGPSSHLFRSSVIWLFVCLKLRFFAMLQAVILLRIGLQGSQWYLVFRENQPLWGFWLVRPSILWKVSLSQRLGWTSIQRFLRLSFLRSWLLGSDGWWIFQATFTFQLMRLRCRFLSVFDRWLVGLTRRGFSWLEEYFSFLIRLIFVYNLYSVILIHWVYFAPKLLSFFQSSTLPWYQRLAFPQQLFHF